MRNSLGRILIFLLTISTIYAEDFTYTLQVDNKKPYLKEAIVLTLELNQTNTDIVLFFNFDIKKSDNYTFTRVDAIEKDSHHNARAKYSYLLYPLKVGDIDIEFNLIKKITTDDNVAFSFSGDRDNVKGLVTKDTVVILDSLELSVKPLPKNTLLVGDFILTHSIKKHKAKSYEPIPFGVTIDGVGYPPILDSILPKDVDFTKFEEEPIVKSKAFINGTKNKIVYPMALSHSKSFELKPIAIKAFNSKTEKSYELKIPKQQFDIEQVSVEELIDKDNSPAVLEQDWSWITTFLSYIIVFIAGYLSAFSLKWRVKKSITKSDPLKEKIECCKDEKELLQLLISTNNKNFSSNIETVEKALYRGEQTNFKKLKMQILSDYHIYFHFKKN